MFKGALNAAADEVVPFLRQLSESISAGESVQDAYSKALADTKVLKHVVGEPVKGMPFSEGLLEGARRSKTRLLVTFAQQLIQNEKTSGSLKEAIKKSAATTMLLAGPQKSADQKLASRRRKQLVVLGVAAAATALIARKRHR